LIAVVDGAFSKLPLAEKGTIAAPASWGAMAMAPAATAATPRLYSSRRP